MNQQREVPSESVRQALNRIRRRDIRALSKIPALVELSIIQDQVSATSVTDLELGRAVRNAITTLIERGIKDNSDFPTEIYWLLRYYVIEGRSQLETIDALHISERTFYELKRAGVEALADLLVTASHQALSIDRSNLPRQLPRPPYNEFIERYDPSGRKLVDLVLDALAPTDRAWVVTVDGVGGIGKTSVAYEAVVRCQSLGIFDAIIWTSAQRSYLSPDRLWPTRDFVSSLDEILNRVALAFRRPSLLKVQLQEKLASVLKIFGAVPCLLVIDQLDSLPDESKTEIEAFIGSIPNPSKVLLTSRWRHQAQRVITVGAMSSEEALQFLSMEMAGRGIRLAQGEMDPVLACAAGIPLAIQYILGQVQSFGAIRTQRLEVRNGNDEELEELLKYIFEASYDKLAEDGHQQDQLLLHAIATLSVPALYDEIAAASQMGVMMESGLGRLYSLFLVTETGSEKDRRFGLLDPTRRFLDALARQNEELRIYREHARERLAQHYSSFRSQSYVEKMRLLRERDVNVLETMGWCYNEGRWELFLQLYDLVGHALSMWSRWSDRVKWGEMAVDVARRIGDWQRVAWHLAHDLGWMYRHMGLTDKAKQTWTEARDIAKQYNHGLAYGLALRNLAVLEHLEGRFEAAESMLVEAIQIFESHDDSRWLGSALSALGRMYTHAERLSEAKQCIERALEHKRKIQEIPGISGCLANLAVVHTELGEYARALQLLEEGARLAQDHVIEEEYANCLIQKLRIEVRTGSANAPQTAHEVRQICERLGATSFLQEIDGIERNLDEQESGHRDVPIW